jgi:hypothetical protein
MSTSTRSAATPSRCPTIARGDGRTIKLEHRFANEIPERFGALAAELAALKVDVLVAVSTPSAVAAQHAITTIPIVFIAVSDHWRKAGHPFNATHDESQWATWEIRGRVRQAAGNKEHHSRNSAS